MSYVPGLEGVIAGQTSISHVEGDIGRLSYRGVPIEQIVEKDYLPVAYLVLFGEWPETMRLKEFTDYLSRYADLTSDEAQFINVLPTHLHPMEALQAMIPLLSLSDETFSDETLELSQGLQILARYPSLLGAINARLKGKALTETEPDADYLSRYLTLLNGRSLTAEQVNAFKVVQLLQLDHSFNAGTFAGRVIGSTLADVTAVMAGSVGALSGRLHGGADEAALIAARQVGGPKNAVAFVDDILASKGRLMGMGHREYKVVDPRSKIVKPLAERLSRDTPYQLDFQTLEAIEMVFNARMAEKGKEVWANLEFYKGVVYQCVGIDPDMFTASFAMARSVGWLAHFRESRENNKIIRPAAEYIGRLPG